MALSDIQSRRLRKFIFALGAVVVFAVYLYVTDDPLSEMEKGSLSYELDALQNQPTTPRETFDGTDERGISLGGSGSGGENQATFEVDSPLVVGVFVGWGVQSDLNGEYLVAYVRVNEELGVEVDMRDITKYSLVRPTNISEGDRVRVYGRVMDKDTIRARSIQ